MKRTLTAILAVVLMLALCIPAFAEETTNEGKITINGAFVGETYHVYQLAMLESFSGTSYSYWLAPDEYEEDGVTLKTKGWRDFFTTEAAKKFFHVSESGYLSTTSEVMQDANKKKMVEDALAYIKTHNIAAVATKVVPAVESDTDAKTNTLVFDNLELGYYLVDTTVGTLLMIDTTDKEMEVTEKNTSPVVTKRVQEDSSGEALPQNDADMFQTVNFRTMIDCKEGATKYVLHDKLSAGLTFINGSISVYNGSRVAVTEGGTDYDPKNRLVEKTSEEQTAWDYQVIVPGSEATDTCSFEIVFSEAFLKTVTSATDLYVYYSAYLNENAVIAGNGNPNDTWLTYGDKQTTEISTTQTFVYEFEMVKTDGAGRYLDGATFTLWDAAEGGNQINVVKEADGTYRLAKEGETGVTITVVDGKTTKITGLDGRTDYFLQEETAPEGYNKLTARQKFTIATANLNISPDNNPDIYSGNEGGVRVVNRTGSVLPDTGGLGTTLFITFGSLIAVAAGVLLITKVRMNKVSE